MAGLVYYPGFSVVNERWLKYALLYLDEISPIVPNEVKWQININDMTRRVNSETDLIKVCIPRWRELMESGRIAITFLEEFIKSPDLLAGALRGEPNLGIGIDILSNWRNPNSHDTQLFDGKFAYTLWEFCNQYDFCADSEDGIMIPSHLANIYMSILANEIAAAQGLDVITDVEECNRLILNHEANTRNIVDGNFEAARSEIDYYLPCNLDSISIERIIQMRNNPDFRAMRSAFSHQIESMLQYREKHDYSFSFDEMMYTKIHLVEYLLKSFDVLAVVATSAVSFGALRNGFQGGDMVPLAISAYTDLRVSLSARETIKKIRGRYHERRFARKYICEISNLNKPVITR